MELSNTTMKGILLGTKREMMVVGLVPSTYVSGLTVAALYWNPCLRRRVTSFPNHSFNF